MQLMGCMDRNGVRISEKEAVNVGSQRTEVVNGSCPVRPPLVKVLLRSFEVVALRRVCIVPGSSVVRPSRGRRSRVVSYRASLLRVNEDKVAKCFEKRYYAILKPVT